MQTNLIVGYLSVPNIYYLIFLVGFTQEQKVGNLESQTETVESSNPIQGGGFITNIDNNVEDSHDHIELKVIELNQEKSDSVDSIQNNGEHEESSPSSDSSHKDLTSK